MASLSNENNNSVNTANIIVGQLAALNCMHVVGTSQCQVS